MVAPGRDEKYSADNPTIARAREPSTSAVVLIPIEAVTEYAECRGGDLALQLEQSRIAIQARGYRYAV
jgi:hypothetical protein